MGRHCSIPWCKVKNSGKNISFHGFPTDIKYRNKWIEGVGLSNWSPTKYSIICSQHFKDDDIIWTSNKGYLKPNAVPTLYGTEPPQRAFRHRPPPAKQANPQEKEEKTNKYKQNISRTIYIGSHKKTTEPSVASNADRLVGTSHREDTQPLQMTCNQDENAFILRDPLEVEIKTEEEDDIESMITKHEVLTQSVLREELDKKDKIIKAMSLEISNLKLLLKNTESKLKKTEVVKKPRLKTIYRLRKRDQRNTARINKLEQVIAIICEDQNINEADLMNVTENEEQVC